MLILVLSMGRRYIIRGLLDRICTVDPSIVIHMQFFAPALLETLPDCPCFLAHVDFERVDLCLNPLDQLNVLLRLSLAM